MHAMFHSAVLHCFVKISCALNVMCFLHFNRSTRFHLLYFLKLLSGPQRESRGPGENEKDEAPQTLKH